jgi:hypothetical protein
MEAAGKIGRRGSGAKKIGRPGAEALDDFVLHAGTSEDDDGRPDTVSPQLTADHMTGPDGQVEHDDVVLSPGRGRMVVNGIECKGDRLQHSEPVTPL